MSAPLSDEAMALTFAQALRARGWTVTPPEGMVMPPPPAPKPEPEPVLHPNLEKARQLASQYHRHATQYPLDAAFGRKLLSGGHMTPPPPRIARLYAQEEVSFEEIRQAGGRDYLPPLFTHRIRLRMLHALADELGAAGAVVFEPPVSDNTNEVDRHRAYIDVVRP